MSDQTPPKTKKQAAAEETARFEAAVLDSGHVPLGPMAKARAAGMKVDRHMKEVRKQQVSTPMRQDATAVRRKK